MYISKPFRFKRREEEKGGEEKEEEEEKGDESISRSNFVSILIFPPFLASFMSTWGGRKSSIS